MQQGPASAAKEDVVIPVIEERLEIGRRTVETGGVVRVHKHVDEVPTEVRESLVTEHVDTERVPIGRVLQEPIGIRHEGDVTIIPVIEERLVMRKELVLVEEIRLTRRREVREAREQVTLRRERVTVERFDPQTQEWLSQDEG
jgi:stress response protein YsnF